MMSVLLIACGVMLFAFAWLGWVRYAETQDRERLELQGLHAVPAPTVTSPPDERQTRFAALLPSVAFDPAWN